MKIKGHIIKQLVERGYHVRCTLRNFYDKKHNVCFYYYF